jgi:molybdate transport system substrate-binding protein
MTDANTRVLTVLTSNSTQPLLDALAARFERETGTAVRVRCDSAKVMLARIKDGETGDVVVLGRAAVDELVTLGRIEPATRRLFARSRVGVAVREGVPHPDISSVEALRRTLLGARAIAHTVHGASGMYVPTLLERLGIAEEMKAKTVTRPGGFIGVVVASGEADIAVQQISELLAVPGIELVGPLPDEVQKVFETATGVFMDSEKPEDARALLHYFSTRECAAMFEEKGLEQP